MTAPFFGVFPPKSIEKHLLKYTINRNWLQESRVDENWLMKWQLRQRVPTCGRLEGSVHTHHLRMPTVRVWEHIWVCCTVCLVYVFLPVAVVPSGRPPEQLGAIDTSWPLFITQRCFCSFRPCPCGSHVKSTQKELFLVINTELYSVHKPSFKYQRSERIHCNFECRTYFINPQAQCRSTPTSPSQNSK